MHDIFFKLSVGFGKPCEGVANPIIMAEQLEQELQ